MCLSGLVLRHTRWCSTLLFAETYEGRGAMKRRKQGRRTNTRLDRARKSIIDITGMKQVLRTIVEVLRMVIKGNRAVCDASQ